jgi:hypothetical protein
MNNLCCIARLRIICLVPKKLHQQLRVLLVATRGGADLAHYPTIQIPLFLKFKTFPKNPLKREKLEKREVRIHKQVWVIIIPLQLLLASLPIDSQATALVPLLFL